MSAPCLRRGQVEGREGREGSTHIHLSLPTHIRLKAVKPLESRPQTAKGGHKRHAGITHNTVGADFVAADAGRRGGRGPVARARDRPTRGAVARRTAHRAPIAEPEAAARGVRAGQVGGRGRVRGGWCDCLGVGLGSAGEEERQNPAQGRKGEGGRQGGTSVASLLASNPLTIHTHIHIHNAPVLLPTADV